MKIGRVCRLLHHLRKAAWSEFRCRLLRGPLRTETAGESTERDERMSADGKEGLLRPTS